MEKKIYQVFRERATFASNNLNEQHVYLEYLDRHRADSEEDDETRLKRFRHFTASDLEMEGDPVTGSTWKKTIILMQRNNGRKPTKKNWLHETRLSQHQAI